MVLLQATSVFHCAPSLSKSLSGSSLRVKIVLVAAGALGFLAALYALCQFYLKTRHARSVYSVNGVHSQSNFLRTSGVQQAEGPTRASSPAEPLNEAARPGNLMLIPAYSVNQPKEPTRASVVQQPEGLLASFPLELINKIANQEDLTLNLRAVSKYFAHIFEVRVFDRDILNYKESPCLAKRLQDIQQDHPTYSMSQCYQALYSRLINEVSLLKEGEDIRQKTLAVYGEAFAAERLHRLEKWLQAVNLIQVFERISLQVPQAKARLDEISLDRICGEDILLQAENVRQWMRGHPQPLSAVETLDLDNQNLTRLPKEIDSLTGLSFLHVRQNKLTALPVEIGNMRRLLNIYLSQNRLQKLPAEIGNLDNLLHLDLSQNRLMSLPEVKKLKQLTELNLSDNQLTAVPEGLAELYKLKQLSLSSNRIAHLPQKIGYLKNSNQKGLYQVS